MTTIALPALPRLAKVTARHLDFGAQLTPPLGGPGQTIARLGSRFAVEVTLPALDAEAARAWIAARLKAKTLGQPLSLVWPQPAAAGLPTGATASGGSQAGSTLTVAGLGAGATVKALSFFSFAAAGRTFLHAVTGETTANGSGAAILPIAPMLRASPANGAALNFTAPVITGYLDGQTVEWDLDMLRWTTTAFTLVENE